VSEVERSGARGFTLLEITVTLAILGVVLMIVYGVFSQAAAGKELAERRGDEAASARAVLARIAKDLEVARPMNAAQAPPPAAQGTPHVGPTPTPTPGPSAVPPQRGLFLGRVHTDAGVALDDLAFTTFVRRPSALTFAGSDLGIVHYFVARISADSPVAGLYRQTLYALNGDSFDPDAAVDPGSATLILAGVTTLDFRFYDGTDWVEEWDSRDQRNFAPAPLAVEITLGVEDVDGRVERYATAVDLPLARGLKNPQLVRPPGAGRAPAAGAPAGSGPI